MTIKNFFWSLYGVFFVLLLALGVVSVLLFLNQQELQRSQEIRYQSYLLADELRQSSDDLTRLARTYVVTADPAYEEQYWAVLAIRNGEQPRPQEYEGRIYWDFVAAGQAKPRPDGETVPLQAMMASLGFTEAEFAKLKEAQANSDGLVTMETIAMNAVKGLYDDGQGNYTRQDTPNQPMAIAMLHSAEYHIEKARIMQPIDEFLVMLDERTAVAVAGYSERSNLYLGLIGGLLAVFVGVAAVSLVLVRRKVTSPLGVLLSSTQGVAHDLGQLAGALGLIAERDLTQVITVQAQPLPMDSRDELGDLARAFNQMIARLHTMGGSFADMTANLRASIQEVAQNAGRVSEFSEQLAGTAAQAGAATQQIATTVQQVAQGTQQQAQSVNRTAGSVEQMRRAIDGVAKGAQEQATAVGKASQITTLMTTAITQVAGNAQAVTRDSATAAEAARSGAKTVQETIQGMAAIKAKVGVSAEKVQEMGQRSDQIGAIVETIDDIASQTNLLALNAAIEAARAGEHGQGFAVVADEVRKLAERASAATKEIGGLIRGIQATVGEAVRAMDEGAKEVETGAAHANEAGRALDAILQAAQAVQAQAEAALSATQGMTASSNQLVGSVDSVSAVVEENTAATEEMAAGAAEVTGAIENIASVSEENSAAVQEVSESTKAMTAQVEAVSASAQSLAEMAGTLQQIVAQFKLGDEASAPSPAGKPALAAAAWPAPVRTNGRH